MSDKIKVRQIEADQIKYDERNLNRHTEKGKQLVGKSIAELGAGRSVLADRNGKLIAGNLTTEEALARGVKLIEIETEGDTLVVVKRKDLDLDSTTDNRARKLALADNSTAAVSLDWNWEEIQSVADDFGFDVGEWGVDMPEEIIAQEVEEDNFNPIDGVETDIVLGDVFEIKTGGLAHRLMCGDSTDSDLVGKLMDGKIADLVFTDPDFAMPIETMLEVYDTSLIYSKGIGFWLGSDKQVVKLANHDFDNFAKCFVQDFRNATIVSNDQPMTRTVLIAQMGRKKMNNLHDAFSTLLQIPTDRVGEQHKLTPMSKKVELPFEFIAHFSDAGDLILDLFGHSGSTMVAATQLKRNCYMMELVPKYCQVILDRMRAVDPEIKIIKNGIPVA